MNEPLGMRVAIKESKRKIKTTWGFGCYRMPIGVTFEIEKYAEVLKEGGRKRICPECLESVIDDFRDELIKAMKSMGMVR